jgi:hypothetical protein
VFTQVQADVKAEANTQLALQDAQEAEKHMHSLSEHETTVVSVLQSTQKDLDAIDNFEDTYLKPLQIFDVVIGEIADVCRPSSRSEPNLSRSTGTSICKDGIWRVVSCSQSMFSFSLPLSPTVTQQSFLQIILAQKDRDAAVLKLLKKIYEVYSFMTQDEKLKQIVSMHTILGRISQPTHECVQPITNYSETRNSCECYKLLRSAPPRASTIITGKGLGKDVLSETNDTIKKYSDVFDKLMQNFWDQVAHNIAIHVHRTGKHSDVLLTWHIFIHFQKSYWTSSV